MEMFQRRRAGKPREGTDIFSGKKVVKPKSRANPHPTIRELQATLVAAVYDAFLPVPVVLTKDYSSFLTQQVAGYTFGWHTFRVAAESSFLLTHGIRFDTIVIQFFLICSVAAVALHLLRRQLWIRWREEICITMNCVYGIVTFLKVFSLVPRLPNETHYLFKHCLLSTADAFFCQVPVHKHYRAQLLDASLRCIVWRRYNVLPGAPTPLVILVSLCWQAWIIMFSAMLQARHVTAYIRRSPTQISVAPAQHGSNDAAAGLPPGDGGSVVGSSVEGTATAEGLLAARASATSDGNGAPSSSPIKYRSRWGHEQHNPGTACASSSAVGLTTTSDTLLPRCHPSLLSLSSSGAHARAGFSSSARFMCHIPSEDETYAALTSLVAEEDEELLEKELCGVVQPPVALSDMTPYGEQVAEAMEEVAVALIPPPEVADQLPSSVSPPDALATGAPPVEVPPPRPCPLRRASAAALAAASCPRPLDLGMLRPGGDGNRHNRQAEASLRRLLRGPSSYVLLAKQRKGDQAVPKTTSVQLCVTSAGPEQLVAHWQDKLAAAVAQGAPGWHLVNASVRKGSLIVHLDLIYQPPSTPAAPTFTNDKPTTANLATTAAATAAWTSLYHLPTPPSPPAAGPGPSAEPGPRETVAPAATTPSPQSTTCQTPTENLERFFLGLGPTGVLDALSLPERLPAGPKDFVSVQLGDRVLAYGTEVLSGVRAPCAAGMPPSGPQPVRTCHSGVPLAAEVTKACAAPTLGEATKVRRSDMGGNDGNGGGIVAKDRVPLVATEIVAAEQATSAEGGLRQRRRHRAERSLQRSDRGEEAGPSRTEEATRPEGSSHTGSSTALLLSARHELGALAEALCLALRPPPLLSSPAYRAFLHARVAPVHSAYANLMAATTLLFYACRFGSGLRLTNILTFMSPELLSMGARAALGDGRMWEAVRAPLVHVGVAVRGGLLIGTSLGWMPRVLKDDDCLAMRWIMKTLVISTLQVLCMQTPVRTAFAVRLLSLAGGLMAHTMLCHPDTGVLSAVALHLGWEGVMLLLAAGMQARHLAAFRVIQLSPSATAATSSLGSLSPLLSPSASCQSSLETVRLTHKQLAATAVAAAGVPAGGSITPETVTVEKRGGTTQMASVANGTNDANSPVRGSGSGSGSGSGTNSSSTDYASAEPDLAGADGAYTVNLDVVGGADDVNSAQSLASIQLDWSKLAEWEALGAVGANGEGEDGAGVDTDPWDVSLDTNVLGMAPRRAHTARLRFTCSSRVVEELQVILRHISPSSMSSGVHTAGPATTVVRTLAPPAATALVSPATAQLRFEAELTLVAAPQDTPGLAHVELWRGRRRLAARPILLAAVEVEGTAASGKSSGAVELPGWLCDVQRYVRMLEADGHGFASEQFIEELGGWLAQLAALLRGLTAASGTAPADPAAAAQRISRVVHISNTWQNSHAHLHYYKPQLVQPQPHGEPGQGAASHAAVNALRHGGPLGVGEAEAPPMALAGGGGSGGCAMLSALRQLLVCQGQGLLAVAVEAGCGALAQHLLALLTGPLGAAVHAALEGAVTPVTALPLLHAAVKSGSPEMVDIVAGWHTLAGDKDIWFREAVVRAWSLTGEAMREGAGSAATAEAPAIATAGDNCKTLPTLPQSQAPTHLQETAPGGKATVIGGAGTVLPGLAAAGTGHALPLPGQREPLVIIGHVTSSATEGVPENLLRTLCELDEEGEVEEEGRLSREWSSGDDSVGLTGSFILDKTRLSELRISDPQLTMGPQQTMARTLLPPPQLSPLAANSPTAAFQAAAPAIIGPSYTSSGVSMAAAAVLADTAQPCALVGLSAPFKVVSLRPGANAGLSAVQELPRDAQDERESAGAGGSLVPRWLTDPRAFAMSGDAVITATPGSLAAWRSRSVPPEGHASSPVGAVSEEPPQLSPSLPPSLFPSRRSISFSQPHLSQLEQQHRYSIEAARRAVNGGLVDNGILLLTPLHVALVLGDEGRIAAHIFAKYPEANGLWQATQAQWLGAFTSTTPSALDSYTVASPFVAPTLASDHWPTTGNLAGHHVLLAPSAIELRQGSSAVVHATHHNTQHRGSVMGGVGVGGWAAGNPSRRPPPRAASQPAVYAAGTSLLGQATSSIMDATVEIGAILEGKGLTAAGEIAGRGIRGIEEEEAVGTLVFWETSFMEGLRWMRASVAEDVNSPPGMHVTRLA